MTSAEKPNLEPYLKVKFDILCNDDWILIDGTLGQLNESTAKKNSLYFQGIFVSPSYKVELKRFLGKTAHWGNVIPEAPERRSEYAGELGWHPDYSGNEEKRYFEVVIGHKVAKLPYLPFIHPLLKTDPPATEVASGPRFMKQPIYKKIPVRRMSRYFATKDYENIKTDDDLGVYIPSNTLINTLKLHKERGTFNFLDSKGKIATISIVDGGPYRTHKNLLYLRADLFKKLLQTHKNIFLMCAHGERQYWPKSMILDRREDLSLIYQADKNTHRQIKEIRVN